MGYPMAINLRNKIAPDRELVICDVNKTAIDTFITETQGKGPVTIVKNAGEMVATAVC
jgi:hypothetical protein